MSGQELAQEADNGNLQRVKDLLAQGVSADSKDKVNPREGEEAGRAADTQTSQERRRSAESNHTTTCQHNVFNYELL
eukprot:g61894.t1